MELLELAARGEIEIAVSQAIIDETIGVLRDKFGFSKERLSETRAVIEACTIMVTPKAKLTVISEDEPDNRILEYGEGPTSLLPLMTPHRYPTLIGT